MRGIITFRLEDDHRYIVAEIIMGIAFYFFHDLLADLRRRLSLEFFDTLKNSFHAELFMLLILRLNQSVGVEANDCAVRELDARQPLHVAFRRSEERRVGKECRSRW